MMSDSIGRVWRRWWPFVGLCAFELLRLNLNDAISGIGATLASQAVACAIGATVCFGFVLARRAENLGVGSVMKPAFAGALLLCGPQAPLFLHPRALVTSVIAISLALVPVVIAVATAAGSKPGLNLLELWPGIIAAAGLALLLPEPPVTDPISDVAMVLMTLLTGIGCVLVCRWRYGSGTGYAFALLLGASTLFTCGVIWNVALFHHAIMIPRFRAVVCDLVLVMLSVLSVQRLRPMQYAARFVMLSLTALVEGAILFRTMPTLRSSAGFLALLISVVALICSGGEPNSGELLLR